MGQWVDCRYDLYALDQIHISYHGTAYPDATPLVLRHHRHREVPPTDVPPSAPATGLNFAQLAATRHQAQHDAQRTAIRYAEPAERPPRASTEEGPTHGES